MATPRHFGQLTLRLLGLFWDADRAATLLLVVLYGLGGLYSLVEVQLLRLLVQSVQQAVQEPAARPAQFAAAVAWGLALALFALLQVWLNGERNRVEGRFEHRLRFAIEDRCYAVAQHLPLEEWERAERHDTLQRVRKGMDQRLGNMLFFFWNMATALVTMLSLLLYLIQFGWLLPTLIVVGTTPGVLLQVGHLRKRYLLERKLSPEERRFDVYRGLLTGRGAAAEARLFGFAPWMMGQADRLRRGIDAERLAVGAYQARRETASQAVRGLVYGAAIIYAVVLFLGGRLALPALAALFYAVESFQQAYRNAVWDALVYANDLRYVADFFAFLDSPRLDLDAGRHLGGRLQHGIVFDDVSFTYPGSDRPALSHLSFTVRAGERLALVGENGAGKSTLAKLLLGLYRPTEGRILVDGVDLTTLAPNGWYRRCGAVFQQYLQLHSTVRENVVAGDLQRQADDARLRAALERSGAAGLVAALPHGVATPIGKEFQEGTDLSIGQWQKLAIARAYFREAELLVLDEPASALDAQAEADVYAHFARMAEERTVLLISHRLGSCRIADRILVLRECRLVEEGTHEELLAAGGEYASLYSLQAEWYR